MNPTEQLFPEAHFDLVKFVFYNPDSLKKASGKPRQSQTPACWEFTPMPRHCSFQFSLILPKNELCSQSTLSRFWPKYWDLGKHFFGMVLQHIIESSKKTSWESYGNRTKTASPLWDWHKKGSYKNGKPLKILLEMENGTSPQPDLHSQVRCLERNLINQQMHLFRCHRVSVLWVMPWGIILLPCSPGIVAWP